MRLFLITSEKFTGTAEILYNNADVLCRIDCTQTNMNAETITAFKRAVPGLVQDIGKGFSQDTTIIESDYTVSLEDFKREYPYSRNYHLLTARWDKMSKTEQVEAYHAAIEYRKYCKRNDWYKPKIADSWLSSKEYKNDWRKM
jgi:hypothetical protein